MLKKLVIQSVCTTLLLSSFISSAAVVNTIAFDESEFGIHTPSATENYGTIIDDEYAAANYDGVNVTFWADKAFDIGNTTSSSDDLFLTVFNTKADFTTLDPDLLVDDTDFGNVAIIHERNGDCAANSCLNPDDRYDTSSSTHGGYVFAKFSEEVILESIGLVDIESGSNQRGEIGFFDANQQLIGDWISMDVTNNGNDGGSTTQLFPSSGAFTYLAVHMIGSGGFTNIEFSRAAGPNPSTVPEPSTLAIFALGVMGLVSRRFKK